MKLIWFAMDCNIYTHPKTLKLAKVLGLEVDAAVGKLGRLWAWAKASGSEDGDVSFLPDEELADLMRWKKKPAILVAALNECGFLDTKKEGKFLHGWDELNGGLCTKLRKDNERKQDINSTEIPRKKKTAIAEIPWEIQSDSMPTVPNRTLPYIPPPPPPVCAYADPGLSRVMTLYLDKITSMPSSTSVSELQGYVERLGPEVAERAINRALDAGKPSWDYIHGVLKRVERQGIRSVADWDRAEREREGRKQNGAGTIDNTGKVESSNTSWNLDATEL